MTTTNQISLNDLSPLIIHNNKLVHATQLNPKIIDYIGSSEDQKLTHQQSFSGGLQTSDGIEINPTLNNLPSALNFESIIFDKSTDDYRKEQFNCDIFQFPFPSSSLKKNDQIISNLSRSGLITDQGELDQLTYQIDSLVMDKNLEREDENHGGQPPLNEGSNRLLFSSQMELRSPFPQASKLNKGNIIFDNITINHTLHQDISHNYTIDLTPQKFIRLETSYNSNILINPSLPRCSLKQIIYSQESASLNPISFKDLQQGSLSELYIKDEESVKFQNQSLDIDIITQNHQTNLKQNQRKHVLSNQSLSHTKNIINQSIKEEILRNQLEKQQKFNKFDENGISIIQRNLKIQNFSSLNNEHYAEEIKIDINEEFGKIEKKVENTKHNYENEKFPKMRQIIKSVQKKQSSITQGQFDSGIFDLEKIENNKSDLNSIYFSNCRNKSIDQKQQKSPDKKMENFQRKVEFCKCKKSKCLKLYCECFLKGTFCTSQCLCQECGNIKDNNQEREKAIEEAIVRNSEAFNLKFSLQMNEVTHKKGCRCKKSHCLKNYCECFNAGLKCKDNCLCSECKNLIDGLKSMVSGQNQSEMQNELNLENGFNFNCDGGKVKNLEIEQPSKISLSSQFNSSIIKNRKRARSEIIEKQPIEQSVSEELIIQNLIEPEIRKKKSNFCIISQNQFP